ncbi:GNAT family N-acetyltransferase [Alkalihalobacterium elongatum]|uniref:GNAT family N-acetyltransferase n=1 Tax=Alkalihalobacterium elongatum TaxID=2675466 RepID=UPI001C1F66FE|nr:GNAT family N-acetyltransferase [Alkalihalobacterium elongatum]
MNSIQIKELTTETEWIEAFPIMSQLRSHLDQNTYVELVSEAADKENYKLAGLYEEDEMLAVIGFMPMITLYYGRFLWVCDLVTDQSKRSKGYGEQLLAYVEKWAKNNGFESVALSSGLQRVDAHRFYEDKMDYHKVSYVFKKNVID